MSDYEVTLVNDNMQEFYVRFFGPPESAFLFLFRPFPPASPYVLHSPDLSAFSAVGLEWRLRYSDGRNQSI